MKIKWTQKELDFLIKNYSIYGLSYCMSTINRPKSSIQDKASQLKLKVDKDVLSKIKKEKLKGINKKTTNSNFKVSHKIFEKILMPEVAYLLGFLWADGYIGSEKDSGIKRNLWMYLIEDDMSILKSTFNKIGNWNYYPRQQEFGNPQIGLHTSNEFLCSFLDKYNYSNKLVGTNILDLIPEKLHHYFLLGLIDGDGNFYSIKKKNYIFNIVSGYEQNWEFVESILIKKDIKYRIKRVIQKNGHKFSRIIIDNRRFIINLGKYIYKDYELNKIGLFRKYKKYIDIESSANEKNSKQQNIMS